MRTAKCVLVFFMVALATTIFGCTRVENGSTTNAASLRDRIMAAGKIRCGYVVYDPGCLKDPNTGKLSGIGPEALELVCKKLGLQLEWTEEVGWGSMLEGLQTRRYDMVATPIWTNANRAKLVEFTKPLYFSPILAYVKSGDKRFVGHLDKVNSADVRIATIDGETAEVIANTDFPNAKKVSLPQLADLSQMLLNVSTGKADIAFAEPAITARFLENNKGAVVEADHKPVRVFSNCWMFNRGEDEFKSMLNTVIDEILNSGELEKIIAKYEPAPHTLYRVAPEYQLPTPKH